MTPPRVNEDPGRIRFEPFFAKMYGDCRKGEVAKRLRPVAWLGKRGGGRVSVTTVNNVNERLAAAVKELDTLSPDMTRFLVPSAGTYNCRTILNTTRLSVHAFAAALDINDKQADYWESPRDRTGAFAWRNRVPGAIGEIFETSARVIDKRVIGSGLIGNGCVGHAASPSASVGGTGRSSTPKIGSPVSRFRKNRRPVFVP